eukprot:CAMPEP_0174926090 /NCGR_PEP_ID=MMETSP1355-20121228/9706_1 /TAXON_ID=464990 /ORGANISM="Hemiselmis tepida, Strain CCMP443" /LENGTH=67 /DNA_ID=CAMNT_0016172099 /DNA_START=57 /DNA_END=256 /DNA_ORIENTATION=-
MSMLKHNASSLMQQGWNMASKVIFPAQLMGFARYGVVGTTAVLWFTHPYGVNFITDTVDQLTSPPPP